MSIKIPKEIEIYLLRIFSGIILLFGSWKFLDNAARSEFNLWATAICLCLGLFALTRAAQVLTGVRTIEKFFDAATGVVIVLLEAWFYFAIEPLTRANDSMSLLMKGTLVFVLIGICIFGSSISYKGQ